MLSLLMEENFVPSGWLGLLLGTDTRSCHTFHGPELGDDSIFEARVSALVREIGDRGKAQRVLAPGYGLAPVDAMMPARRRPSTSDPKAVVAATSPGSQDVAPTPVSAAAPNAPMLWPARVPAGLPADVAPAVPPAGNDDFLSRLPPAAAAAVRKARGLPDPPVAATVPLATTSAPTTQVVAAPSPASPRTVSVAQSLLAAPDLAREAAPTTVPDSSPDSVRAKSVLDPNMAAGFSRTVHRVEQEPPQQLRQASSHPPEEPPNAMKWSTNLDDLATACGAESPDALLNLTDDQLEQLIAETSSKNPSFHINTLHQMNIAREAREKRAAAQQDPLMKFLTDLALQRIYDRLVHGLGALYLEDLKDVEEADFDEMGLRKLEKRRLCRAIAELDELDETLLRTPVTPPLQTSAVAEESSQTAAAVVGMLQAKPNSVSTQVSRVAPRTPEDVQNNCLQSQQPATSQWVLDLERDVAVADKAAAIVEHATDFRASSDFLPASPNSPTNHARSCPGTPSSWRDDYSQA